MERGAFWSSPAPAHQAAGRGETSTWSCPDTHTHVHTHRCIHAPCTQRHTHTSRGKHRQVHATWVHTHEAHPCTHVHRRACTHTHAHTGMYAHAQRHTHIHVQALRRQGAEGKKQLSTFSPERSSVPLPRPAWQQRTPGVRGPGGRCLWGLMVSHLCLHEHLWVRTSDGKDDSLFPLRLSF